MKDDEELKQEILARLPIEGPGSFCIEDSKGYHFGRYDEATTVATQKILQLVRQIEQSAYERGKQGEPL